MVTYRTLLEGRRKRKSKGSKIGAHLIKEWMGVVKYKTLSTSLPVALERRFPVATTKKDSAEHNCPLCIHRNI
jgi:hypothetical protein